jgi:hypothetical protein
MVACIPLATAATDGDAISPNPPSLVCAAAGSDRQAASAKRQDDTSHESTSLRRPQERIAGRYGETRDSGFYVTPPRRRHAFVTERGDANRTVQNRKDQPRREHRQAGGEDGHLGRHDAAKNPPISGGSAFASA